MTEPAMKPCTMTLNLPQKEMDVLEKLATDIDVSKTTLMRRALRLYQEVTLRIAAGETIHFSGDAGRKAELCMLMELPIENTRAGETK